MKLIVFYGDSEIHSSVNIKLNVNLSWGFKKILENIFQTNGLTKELYPPINVIEILTFRNVKINFD